MMLKQFLVLSFILLLFSDSIYLSHADTYGGELNTKLNFPQYAYKRSSKFEHKFQNMLSKCETETECSKYNSFVRQNCLLKCVSKNCYAEIYSFDPLEDGEIDQRLTSFKGCYSTEIN